MSSSWFANIINVSKRKPERITVVEASEATVTEEGFTIIQPQAPYPLYPAIPPPPPSTTMQPLPYPVMSSGATHQAQSPTHVVKPNHLLDGIPFVISPKLESSMSQILPDVENIRRSIVQLTADISDSWFDYDFKVERNVLKELCHNNET